MTVMFFPWVEVHRDLRKLDVEDRRRLLIEPGAVGHGVLPPLLELDNDLDALLLPDGADPEDRGDVDEPDAADLHIVPLELVAAADQHVRAAPLY
jgi:hypothetical protein